MSQPFNPYEQTQALPVSPEEQERLRLQEQARKEKSTERVHANIAQYGAYLTNTEISSALPKDLKEDLQVGFIENIKNYTRKQEHENTSKETQNTSFASPDDALVFVERSISDKQAEEVSETFLKLSQLQLFAELWSESANKTASDMWFKSLRDGDDTIRHSALQNEEMFERARTRILQGNIPSAKNIEITTRSVFSFVARGEEEASIIWEDGSEIAKNILSSNLSDADKRLAFYVLFRKYGHYEQVIPRLWNDLVRMPEFWDIQTILANPQAIEALHAKNISALKEMGVSEKLAQEAIELYEDTFREVEKEALKNFQESEENTAHKKTPEELKQLAQAYAQAYGEITTLEFLKQGLLSAKIIQNPSLQSDRRVGLYGDMMGLGAWCMSDKTRDICKRVWKEIAILAITTASGMLIVHVARVAFLARMATVTTSAVEATSSAGAALGMKTLEFSARAGIEGLAFYEWSHFANTLIRKESFEKFWTEARNGKEIAKSIAFFAVMNALAAKYPNHFGKESQAKIKPGENVPLAILKDTPTILLQSLALTGTGLGIDVAFEGHAHMTWEEYIKILMFVGMVRQGPNTGKWIIQCGKDLKIKITKFDRVDAGPVSSENPQTQDLHEKLENPSSLNVKHPKEGVSMEAYLETYKEALAVAADLMKPIKNWVLLSSNATFFQSSENRTIPEDLDISLNIKDFPTLRSSAEALSGTRLKNFRYMKINSKEVVEADTQRFKELLENGDLRFVFDVPGKMGAPDVEVEGFMETQWKWVTQLGHVPRQIVSFSVEGNEVKVSGLMDAADLYGVNLLHEYFNNTIEWGWKVKDATRIHALTNYMKEADISDPVEIVPHLKKTIDKLRKYSGKNLSPYLATAVSGTIKMENGKEVSRIDKLSFDLEKMVSSFDNFKRQGEKFDYVEGDVLPEFQEFIEKMNIRKKDLRNIYAWLQSVETLSKTDKAQIENVLSSYKQDTDMIRSKLSGKNQEFAYFYEIDIIDNVYINQVEKLLNKKTISH